MATITGTSRHDEREGTEFDDLMRGLGGDDVLEGDDGNDTISGDEGNDFIEGQNGDDLLNGGAGNDSLYGDLQYGDPGDDVANGGTGYDYLYGFDGNDTLRGQAGDDYLDGGAGDDVLDGGSEAEPFSRPEWQEWDRIEFNEFGSPVMQSGVDVNFATGVALDPCGGTDTLIDIEEVKGTRFNDTLIGGNPLNDALESFIGGGGKDIIDGGSGFDIVSYSAENGPKSIIVDLAARTVVDTTGDLDTVRNVELIVATWRDDQLLGSKANDGFAPGLGFDYINGRGGSDTVNYRYGISTGEVIRGLDADLERGVIYDSRGSTDQAVSIENLVGSIRDDVIRGSSVSNMLDGWEGDDLIKGRSGNDHLKGFRGNDYVDGGTGTDIIEGGQGNDTLRGGGSGDTFVFGSDCDEDHILDFKTGTDKIDVGAFSFASTADVLAKLVILSPGAAMLDLGGDNYVIFDYVNTANTVLAAGDIII